jgi:hypothetical protein
MRLIQLSTILFAANINCVVGHQLRTRYQRVDRQWIVVMLEHTTPTTTRKERRSEAGNVGPQTHSGTTSGAVCHLVCTIGQRGFSNHEAHVT